MRASYLVKGLPGHPLHPPLTDLTIGTYTFATIAAVLDVTGIVERDAAIAWWLALVVGLGSTALTASTGFIDWIELEWGSGVWRTATAHLTAMLAATALFLGAVFAGRGGHDDGVVTGAAFALTLVGFALLTLGGWLGGSVVFVHGTRVLRLVRQPTLRPPE